MGSLSHMRGGELTKPARNFGVCQRADYGLYVYSRTDEIDDGANFAMLQSMEWSSRSKDMQAAVVRYIKSFRK